MINYLPMIDKYLGKYFLFTAEEMIEADHLEQVWKDSLKKYSLHQLLQIFPQAKPTVKRNLLAEIKQCKADLTRAEEIRIRFNNKVLSSVKLEDKPVYSMLRDMFYVDPLKEGRQEKIKKNHFLLSSLKTPTKTAGKGISNADILRAKQVPIENLYSGQTRMQSKTLVGKCPFHIEKSGSFMIYTKQNRFYCFGCQAGTDSIDFLMKRDNCDFVTAVKKLIHA